MPTTCCCVPNCSNRGGHLFPKDEKRKKMWLIAIKRNLSEDTNKEWTPNKHSVVCKEHFVPTDYVTQSFYGESTLKAQLKREAVPSIFSWKRHQTDTSRSERLAKRRKHKNDQDIIEDLSFDGEADEYDTNVPDIQHEELISCTEENEQEENFKYTAEKLTRHNAESQTKPWPSLCIEKFSHDDAGILFYTGLATYSDFVFVLATLGEAAYNLNYFYNNVEQLNIENQFFLTLIKLRQHKTNFELSRLFSISEHSVMNIWITWVNFMAKQWREVNVWAERDLVRFFSPLDFKSKFPTTRVIIDGTEIPVKKPKLPIAQQSTFSSYKNRNTIKVLVGCSPGGLVSFLSPAYGGSVSDRQIMERTNLTAMCDPGDSVMADKGFNVQDLFATSDVTVNIPTFFKKMNRMTGKTVLRDRRIASKRVHVERIIGLAKTYKILKTPLNRTETKLGSEIIFVVFMLCNFKQCIMPKHA